MRWSKALRPGSLSPTLLRGKEEHIFILCEIRCLLKSEHSRQPASDICVLSTGMAITCGMLSVCSDAALLSVCPEAALLTVSETLLGLRHVWKNILTRVYNLKGYSASSKDTPPGTDCSRAFGGHNLCGNVKMGLIIAGLKCLHVEKQACFTGVTYTEVKLVS